MIEVGSFMALAALTESEITIKGAGVHQLGINPKNLRKAGNEFYH
jgi:UDP-N-acetylglucosamine 1-carboxyvinyltransferase